VNQPELVALTKAPYPNYWEAYRGIARLEQHFLQAGDRRAIFATVYALTTRRIAESIDRGLYRNAAWMGQYQTEFANHYRKALLGYAQGERGRVPKVWLVAFDRAKSGQTLILQDALLGMNAHINFDLPFAIEKVHLSPDTHGRHADHTLVNQTLAQVTQEIVSALGTLYGATNYALLADALGPLDDLWLKSGMASARENAWTNATLLTRSSFWNRWLIERGIAAEATAAGDLILALTVNAHLKDALWRAEGSNAGSALFVALSRPTSSS
jgi:hypothetical protein